MCVLLLFCANRSREEKKISNAFFSVHLLGELSVISCLLLFLFLGILAQNAGIYNSIQRISPWHRTKIFSGKKQHQMLLLLMMNAYIDDCLAKCRMMSRKSYASSNEWNIRNRKLCWTTDNLLLGMRVLLVIPLIIFVCIVVPRYNFVCVIRRFCLHFCFGIVNWLVFFEMENFLPISFLFPFLFSPSCSPPIRPSNYSSSRSVHPMLHIASILSYSKRYNWWYLLNSDRMKVSAFAASSRLLQKIQQMKTEKLKKLVHASCALCFVVSLAVDLTYFRLLFINVSATTARGKKNDIRIRWNPGECSARFYFTFLLSTERFHNSISKFLRNFLSRLTKAVHLFIANASNSVSVPCFSRFLLHIPWAQLHNCRYLTSFQSNSLNN